MTEDWVGVSRFGRRRNELHVRYFNILIRVLCKYQKNSENIWIFMREIKMEAIRELDHQLYDRCTKEHVESGLE